MHKKMPRPIFISMAGWVFVLYILAAITGVLVAAGLWKVEAGDCTVIGTWTALLYSATCGLISLIGWGLYQGKSWSRPLAMCLPFLIALLVSIFGYDNIAAASGTLAELLLSGFIWLFLTRWYLYKKINVVEFFQRSAADADLRGADQ